MSICTKCKVEFEKTSNTSYCRPCRKAYDKKRYEQDKGIGRTHSKEWYYKKQEYVKQAKSVPCFDCEIQYPYYVMEFDHLPEFVKISHVSKLVASGSMPSLLEEIAKCEVVCANCHRERTQQRKLLQQHTLA
jgi:hypothetical protein